MYQQTSIRDFFEYCPFGATAKMRLYSAIVGNANTGNALQAIERRIYEQCRFLNWPIALRDTTFKNWKDLYHLYL